MLDWVCIPINFAHAMASELGQQDFNGLNWVYASKTLNGFNWLYAGSISCHILTGLGVWCITSFKYGIKVRASSPEKPREACR